MSTKVDDKGCQTSLPNIDDLLQETKFEPSQNTSLPEARKEPKDEFTTGHPKTADAKPQPRGGRLFEDIGASLGKVVKDASEFVNPYLDTIKTNAVYHQLESLQIFFEERGLAFDSAPIRTYVDYIYAVLMADGVDEDTKSQFNRALNNIILSLQQLLEKREPFEKYVAGTQLEAKTLNAFEEFFSNYAAQLDGYDVGGDVLEYSFVEIESLLMEAKKGFELKESLPALIKAGVHSDAPNIACNYDDFIEDSLALVTKDDLNSAPFPRACQALEAIGMDPQKLLRWAMNPNADHTDRKMVEAGLALYKAMTISAADRLDDIGWMKKLEETETVDAATVKILEQKLAMVRKELEVLKHEVEEKIVFKDEAYKNAVLSELNSFVGGEFTLHEFNGDVSAKFDSVDPVIRTQDDAPASDEYQGSLNIVLATLQSGNATPADIAAAARELERANLLMLKAAEIKRGGFEDDGYVPELKKVIDDRVAMLEGMKKQLDETGHGTFKFNFFAGDYYTSTLAFDKAIDEYRALLTLPEEEAWGRFASLERSPLMKTLQKRFDDMEFGEFCRELGITTLTTIPTLGGAGLVRAGLTRLLGAVSATNLGKDLIFAGELVYFTASGAGMGKVLNNNPLLPYDNVEENLLFYGKDLLIGALTLRLFHGVENGIGGMMFKKAEAEATTRLVNRGIIKAGATLNAEQFKLLAAETKLVMNGFKHGAQTLGLRFPALFVGMTGIAQVDAVVEGVKAWDVQVALDGAAAAFDKKTMLLRLWSTLDMIAVGIMTGPIIKAANEAAVRKIVDGYRGKIDSALDGYAKAKTEWERGGKQGTKEFEAAIKKLESVIQEGKQLAKTYPQYFDMWGLVTYEMYLDKVREAAAEVNRKPEYVAEKLPIVDLAQRLEGVPNVVLPDWGVSEPVAPNVTPSEEAPKVPTASKASERGQVGSDAMTPKQPNPRQHRMPVADGIPLAQLKPNGFVEQAKGIVGRGVNNALAEVGVGAKEVVPRHYLLEPGTRTYTSQGEYSEPFSAGWGVAMRVLKKFAGRMHELDRETYNNAVDAETKDPLVRYKAKSEYDTIIDCQGIEPLKGRRYMGGIEIGDGNHRASAASGFPLLVEEGTTEGNPKPARVLGGKRDATFDVLLKQQLDVLEIRKDDLARPIYTKMIAAYKLGDVGKYREALERLAGLREELKSQPSNRARKLLLEQIDKRIKFLKWRAQHPAPQLNPADWTERPTKGALETAREAEYRAGVWKGVEAYAASVGGYIMAAFNDATGAAASGDLLKAGRAIEKNHGRLSDEKTRAEVLDFLERQVIPKVTGELKTPFAVERSFNVRTKVGERVFTFKAEFDGAVLKVSVKDGDGKIIFSESRGDLVLMHGGFPFDMAAKQLWQGLKTLFKIDGKTEASEAKDVAGPQPASEGGQVSPAKVKNFALDEASSRPLKDAAKLKDALATAKSINDFVAILKNAGVADVEVGGKKYSSNELAQMCEVILYGSKAEAFAAAKDLGWVGELFGDIIYKHQEASNFFPQFHEVGGVYRIEGSKLQKFIQNTRDRYYEGRLLFYKLVPDGMKNSEGDRRLGKLLRDLRSFDSDADSFGKLIKIFNDSGLEVGWIVADLQLIQQGRLSPKPFLKKLHSALDTKFLPFDIERIVDRTYRRENAAHARAHLIGFKDGIDGEVLPTAGSWALEAHQLQKKIAAAKSIEELKEILKGTELVSISIAEVRGEQATDVFVVKAVLEQLSRLEKLREKPNDFSELLGLRAKVGELYERIPVEVRDVFDYQLLQPEKLASLLDAEVLPETGKLKEYVFSLGEVVATNGKRYSSAELWEFVKATLSGRALIQELPRAGMLRTIVEKVANAKLFAVRELFEADAAAKIQAGGEANEWEYTYSEKLGRNSSAIEDQLLLAEMYLAERAGLEYRAPRSAIDAVILLSVADRYFTTKVPPEVESGKRADAVMARLEAELLTTSALLRNPFWQNATPQEVFVVMKAFIGETGKRSLGKVQGLLLDYLVGRRGMHREIYLGYEPSADGKLEYYLALGDNKSASAGSESYGTGHIHPITPNRAEGVPEKPKEKTSSENLTDLNRTIAIEVMKPADLVRKGPMMLLPSVGYDESTGTLIGDVFALKAGAEIYLQNGGVEKFGENDFYHHGYFWHVISCPLGASVVRYRPPNRDVPGDKGEMKIFIAADPQYKLDSLEFVKVMARISDFAGRGNIIIEGKNISLEQLERYVRSPQLGFDPVFLEPFVDGASKGGGATPSKGYVPELPAEETPIVLDEIPRPAKKKAVETLSPAGDAPVAVKFTPETEAKVRAMFADPSAAKTLRDSCQLTVDDVVELLKDSSPEGRAKAAAKLKSYFVNAGGTFIYLGRGDMTVEDFLAVGGMNEIVRVGQFVAVAEREPLVRTLIESSSEFKKAFADVKKGLEILAKGSSPKAETAAPNKVEQGAAPTYVVDGADRIWIRDKKVYQQPLNSEALPLTVRKELAKIIVGADKTSSEHAFLVMTIGDRTIKYIDADSLATTATSLETGRVSGLLIRKMVNYLLDQCRYFKSKNNDQPIVIYLFHTHPGQLLRHDSLEGPVMLVHKNGEMFTGLSSPDMSMAESLLQDLAKGLRTMGFNGQVKIVLGAVPSNLPPYVGNNPYVVIYESDFVDTTPPAKP